MPLTRFVLASSQGISSWTPLKPQHTNPNPLANQLLCIDFLPLLSSSLTDSLPSLNLLCHSKTDAWFMQDAPKAEWSIPYVSVVFFPILEQNFIAYRSSKVSDCIFEIQQLWLSGFSRVYSNCCCSCSFECEIIKSGQSSHKMYSNNILNIQESTTILNACTRKVWKLIECTTYIYMHFHPQTDSFVISQLFSVTRHVGRLKLGSKSAQIYVRLNIILLILQENHVNSGIIRHYAIGVSI